MTDGDIRRALISGVEISEPVEKVMHTRFISATPGDDVCIAIAEGLPEESVACAGREGWPHSRCARLEQTEDLPPS